MEYIINPKCLIDWCTDSASSSNMYSSRVDWVQVKSLYSYKILRRQKPVFLSKSNT